MQRNGWWDRGGGRDGRGRKADDRRLFRLVERQTGVPVCAGFVLSKLMAIGCDGIGCVRAAGTNVFRRWPGGVSTTCLYPMP